jgi:hypothetical protein
VILGASVSAGFQDFEGKMHPLSAPWNAIVAKTGRSAASFADAMFFLEPAGSGSRQVRSALAKDPTLVLAADFLFWYGYGEFKSDDDRQARLRQGLDELARFGCPVVAGDLPDVSPGIGKMIRASQVPSKDSLRKLNETVTGWAAARKNVTLLPLSGILPKLYKGEPLETRGNRWAEGEAKRLLHSDLLHLTEEGTAALAVLLADAVCKSCPDVPSDALTFDLESIVKSGAVSRPASRPASREPASPASRPAK